MGALVQLVRAKRVCCGTGVVNELTRRILAAGVAILAAFLLGGCAGPFNQVTPCVINCAVTLQGSPATAQQPAPVVVERALKSPA